MDDLPRRILAFSQKYGMLPEGGLILCAVSGGADSMCLLKALTELSRDGKFSVAAAHYNHKLRGAASDSDEAFVRGFCEKSGIPLHVESGDVTSESRLRKMGIEETARNMRYDFLERAAAKLGAARIATAHNSEDNAETVLMNLVRGSALTGLAGIPPVRGAIVRPLLQTGRDQILLYLAEQNVSYVEDATNYETEYTRNKWRHLLFPLLRDLNPRAPEAIGRAAFLAGEDDAFLYSLARRAVVNARTIPGGLVLKASSLEALPSPVASRALLLLAEQVSDGRGGRSSLHVENALGILRGGGASASCQLPGGVSFSKEYGRLFLLRGRHRPSFSPISLSRGKKAVLMDGLWEIDLLPCEDPNENIFAPPFVFRLKRDMINGPLLVRPREPGDRIRLAGGVGSRSLKRLFIDAKVPLSLRDAVPVVVSGGRVVAAAGFGTDEAFAAPPGEDALVITVKGDILDG